ncbi:MAG: Omp28-related outer membrane protein [Flavobacteriales bacterium]|nr:Omp28-related outer membrane protein [Flavobacteriales bacterium]
MKKQLLFVFALLTCSALSAQVYMSENFDGAGTTLPSGWSVTTADATSDGWLRDVAANLASTSWGYPDNGTKIMSTNDDGCNCNKSADRLIFPSVDLSVATAPFLLFDQYYFAQTYQSITETAFIEVSTNGGTSWTQLSEVTANTTNGWQSVAFSLAAYAGQTNVTISVLYDDNGGWLYGFGIDNASVQEQPDGLNLAVSGFTAAPLIEAIPSLVNASQVVVGREIYFVVDVTNSSGDVINSFDITVTNGSQTVSQSFSAMGMNWLASESIVLDTPIAANSGNNNYSVTVSNINGGNDDNSADNSSSSTNIAGVTLHPDKAVVIEEATGTWCGWCPRGTVMMDYMSEAYPNNFIGIAVHNADPMVVSAYDTWIGGQINGYPSILADRDGVVYDPLDMEDQVVEKAQAAPSVTCGVTHSLSGSTLTVDVSATYNENLSGDYRFNVILVEDHITGSGGQWPQTNYYSGGGNGPMGAFDEAGASVSGIYYDHVGRALLGGTTGMASSLPASGTAGSTYTYQFTTTVDATWNLGWMKPVVLVINATTGEIVNAKFSELTIQVNEVPTLDNSLIVYPNPSNGIINIQSNMANVRQADVRVFSATGELVLNTQINDIRQQNILDVTEFGSGIYTIMIESEGHVATRRVTVSK